MNFASHPLAWKKLWVFPFSFLKHPPHHVQLAIVRCEGWHGIGGQSAGCQRVVGVHGRAVLVVSVGRDGRVEARPEHPQVDGTCERRGRRRKRLLQCGRQWWHFLNWHPWVWLGKGWMWIEVYFNGTMQVLLQVLMHIKDLVYCQSWTHLLGGSLHPAGPSCLWVYDQKYDNILHFWEARRSGVDQEECIFVASVTKELLIITLQVKVPVELPVKLPHGSHDKQLPSRTVSSPIIAKRSEWYTELFLCLLLSRLGRYRTRVTMRPK